MKVLPILLAVLLPYSTVFAQRTIIIDTKSDLTQTPTVKIGSSNFGFPAGDPAVDTLHSIKRLDDGTVELVIKGDFVLLADDTLRGIGNYPVVIRVGNDAYIPETATIDFSAISVIPGAGGGKAEAGGEGGDGGEKGRGGRGGEGGKRGSGGVSFTPSLSPFAITTPGIPAGDGTYGGNGVKGGDGAAGEPGKNGRPGFSAPVTSAGVAGDEGDLFPSVTKGANSGIQGTAANYPPKIYFQSPILRDWFWNYGTSEEAFRQGEYDGIGGAAGLDATDWEPQAPGSSHEGGDATPGTHPTDLWTLSGGSAGGSGGGGAGGAGGTGGGGGGGGAGGQGEWKEPINTGFITTDLADFIFEGGAATIDYLLGKGLEKVVNAYWKSGELDLNLTPIYDYGATGGKGGDGGDGGFGTEGGKGGDGGNGGAGGGALLIEVQGRIFMDGAILANGADGGAGAAGALAPPVASGGLLGLPGGSRIRGYGMSTILDPASALEDEFEEPRSGRGGRGGDGALGGRGLDGFPGGDGGGGSAGTIILSASSILNPGSTASFEVEGGESTDPGLKGDDGRIFIGSNVIAPGTDTTTLLTSESFSLTGTIPVAPTRVGPQAPNPFIAGRPLTPTISELRDGAEAFGLLAELSDALQANGVDLRSNVPPGGDEPVICAMRFDVGPPPYDEDYHGHDLILVFNFLNQPLTEVRFGANPQPLISGAPDPANLVSFNSIPLTEGGFTKDPAYGGTGDVESAALAPFEVFALLIPEDTPTTGHNFAITASNGEVIFRHEEQHFENGEIICATGNADVPVYVAEWNPSVGQDGNWNDATNWDVTAPDGEPDRDTVIPNNVIEVAAYNVGINLADADVTQDTSITIDRLRIGPTNTLTIQNDYQLLLKKFDVRPGGGLVENQGIIMLDSTDLTAPPTSLKFQGQALSLSGPGLLTTSLNPNNLIGSDLVVDYFIQESGHTIRASGMFGNGNLNFTNRGLVESHSGVALGYPQTLTIDPSYGSDHYSPVFINEGNLLVGNEYSELILDDGYFENLPGGFIGFDYDAGSPPPADNTQLLQFNDVRLRGGMESIDMDHPGQVVSFTGTNIIEDVTINTAFENAIHVDNADLTLRNATLNFFNYAALDSFTTINPAQTFNNPGLIDNSTITGGIFSYTDVPGLYTCDNPSVEANMQIQFRPLLTGSRVTLNNTTIDGSYCYDAALLLHESYATDYYYDQYDLGIPRSNAFVTMEVFTPELDLDGTINNNGIFDFKNFGNGTDHTDVLIGPNTILGGSGAFDSTQAGRRYTFRAQDGGPSVLTVEENQNIFKSDIFTEDLQVINNGRFFDVSWDYDANPAGAPTDPDEFLAFLKAPTLGINNNYMEPNGVFGGGVLDNRNGVIGLTDNAVNFQNIVIFGGHVTLDYYIDQNWTQFDRSTYLNSQIGSAFNTEFRDVTFSTSNFIPELGDGAVLYDGFPLDDVYQREIGLIDLHATSLNKDGTILPAVPMDLTDTRFSTHVNLRNARLANSLTVDTGVIAHLPQLKINGDTELIANQTDPGTPFYGTLMLSNGLSGSSSLPFVLPADFVVHTAGLLDLTSLPVQNDTTLYYGGTSSAGEYTDFFGLSDLTLDADGDATSAVGFVNNGIIRPIQDFEYGDSLKINPGNYDNRNGIIYFSEGLSGIPTINGALIEGGLISELNPSLTAPVQLSNGAILRNLDIKGLNLYGDSTNILENVNILDRGSLNSSTILSGNFTVVGDLTYNAPGSTFTFFDVPSFDTPTDRLVVSSGTTIEIQSSSQPLTGVFNEGTITDFSDITLSTPTNSTGETLDPSTLVATTGTALGELVTLESLGYTTPFDLISTSSIVNRGLIDAGGELTINQAVIDNSGGTIQSFFNSKIIDSIIQNENGTIGGSSSTTMELFNAMILGGTIDGPDLIRVLSTRYNPDTMQFENFGADSLTTLQNVTLTNTPSIENYLATFAIIGTVDASGSYFYNSGDLLIAGISAVLMVDSMESDEKITFTGGSLNIASFFDNYGIIEGTGSINTTSSFYNYQTLAPGLSAGQLDITADEIYLDTGGSIQIELGGSAPGTGYDQINFESPSAVELGGTLSVSVINDFGICYADTFEIITANIPHTGSFTGIPSGTRIPVSTGGSIVVYYGAGSPYGLNNVVLAEYIAGPSTYFTSPYSANFEVTQLAPDNAITSIVLTTLPGTTTGMFHDDTLSNRGDYALTFPAGVTPLTDGVIIPSVSQTLRTNAGVTDYPTTCIFPANNTFYIGVMRRGSAGEEFNTNFAVSFFDFDEWLCGYGQNLAGNNLPVDNLVASPGINLGTEYQRLGPGEFKIDLTGLGAHSNDGILLTTGVNNDDNITTSWPHGDGHFIVYSRDNDATDPTLYEDDPIAFAYIPFDAVNRSPLVAAGRVLGDGDIHAGTKHNTGTDVDYNFEVIKLSSNSYQLSIPGHAPSTGTLIVNSQGGHPQIRDNYVSYTPSGDNWIITSATVPGTSDPNLSVYGNIFSFAFFTAEEPIAVTTCEDELDAVAINGTGISLREAVRDSAPGSMIRFAPNMAGQTIHVTAGQILIDKDLRLDGTSVPFGVTISGEDNSRIFEIAANTELTIDSLYLRDGNATGNGGAILCNGQLNLIHSTLAYNTCTGNGGAIATVGDGNAYLRNSTLAHNSAPTGKGGAISHASGFFGNTITFDGAFLTIARNSATNGGAIHSANEVLANSSIFSNNTAPTNTTFFEDYDANEDAYIDYYDGLDFEAGDSEFNDPKLLPLADYGGLTPTMHLSPDSAALSGGDFRSIDQRGFAQGVEVRTVGATLFRGYDDLIQFWDSDYDEDNMTLGLEFILGTNPAAADRKNPRRTPVVARNGSGQPTVTFSRKGYLADTLTNQYTIVRVLRSVDLIDWQEIYRHDELEGPFTQPGYSVQNDFFNGSFTITETSATPAPRAYYRVQGLLVEEK